MFRTLNYSTLAMEDSAETFLYFAYGSNLNSRRIFMNNPTAVRKGIGKLNNYRLDFSCWSANWQGCVATIVPDPYDHVWGAIWELNKCDINNLDKQENVDHEIYKVIYVTVETPDHQNIICRCYQLCSLPTKINDGDSIPENRKPSLAYIKVILEGAEESLLPEYYINRLKNIPHNEVSECKIKKIML